MVFVFSHLVGGPLDGLLGLGVGLVGVVQGDLHLVDVRLKLLLDPAGEKTQLLGN